MKFAIDECTKSSIKWLSLWKKRAISFNVHNVQCQKWKINGNGMNEFFFTAGNNEVPSKYWIPLELWDYQSLMCSWYFMPNGKIWRNSACSKESVRETEKGGEREIWESNRIIFQV